MSLLVQMLQQLDVKNVKLIFVKIVHKFGVLKNHKLEKIISKGIYFVI
jgi:hypothetical protein